MAGTDIAIDLGSANFRLYVDGKGVVVDEPNVIAVDEDSNRVVAVGRRAYKMLGRTSDRVRVVKPVTGGVISDLTLMDATLQHYLKKVTNSRVFMPRAVVAVPSGITEVERRAVVDAVAANGIRKVCLIETPVAAAIGAGLDISRPHGSMVVTLGEGVSDIGVLSMNRLSVSGSIAVGGAVFNEDIIKYARRKFDLIIGEQTTEAAKCAVGCAFPLKGIEKYELRGRDERNGLPAKVEVTSDEIGEAMLESVVKVVHKIQSVLEETPPELTADIGNAGIVLTGGGAKLRGLDTLISKQTKMRVRIAEEPEDCVILGAGRAVQWIDSVKMDAGKENGNVPLTAYY
ncbi:rod shape-determining protein [Hominenteromicrobium sp.]|uniref:rod shape-determining protein n=1 Tax=Hominenteromicrobium sp. TaxID=3073581 RepID=UPI003AB58086